MRSPYYLDGLDNLGNIIVPIILDRENYANWNRVVVNALKFENKYGFVNSDITRPDDVSPHVHAHAWVKCNSWQSVAV